MTKRAGKKSHSRLRERFKNNSLEDFDKDEIIELLLSFTATPKEADAVACALIERFKGLRGVLDASVEELMEVRGLGKNAALLIKLTKEVAGEYLRERIMKRDVIKDKVDVLNYLKLKHSGDRDEKFLAIYLNSKNEVLSVETLHEGTIDQTAVYPRKAIEMAFKYNASSVIFVHNHPSGDATPSMHDRYITKRLDKASMAVDIAVLDHIIIGRKNHFSAREHGWLTAVHAQPLKAAEL